MCGKRVLACFFLTCRKHLPCVFYYGHTDNTCLSVGRISKTHAFALVVLLAEVNAAPDASVGRVVWHPQTNQIICSTSAGGVRVMYDPAISDKGAMLSAGRSHSRLNTNMFLPKHAVRFGSVRFTARFGEQRCTTLSGKCYED